MSALVGVLLWLAVVIAGLCAHRGPRRLRTRTDADLVREVYKGGRLPRDSRVPRIEDV